MTNPNDPAFPDHEAYGGDAPPYYSSRHVGGLTKREYYAGLAMQGCIASNRIIEGLDMAQIVAKASRRYADALITELSKERENATKS